MALGIADAAKKKFGKTPTQESAAAKQLKEGYAKYVEKVQKESGKVPFKEAIRRSGGGGGSSASQPAQQVSSVATPTQAAQVTTQPTAPTQTQQQSVAAQQVQQGYAAYVQKQQQQRQPLFTPEQQQQAKQKFVQRVAIEKQRQAEEKAKPIKQRIQETFKEKVAQPVQEKVLTPTSTFVYEKAPWLREPVDIVTGQKFIQGYYGEGKTYKQLTGTERLSGILSGEYSYSLGVKRPGLIDIAPNLIVPAYTPTQTQLIYRGAAQYGDDGLIYTKTQFATPKISEGQALSITKVIPGEEGKSIVMTKTYGATKGVYANFPDEIISTKPQQVVYQRFENQFTSQEMAGVITKDKFFGQIGMGKTTSLAGKSQQFTSVGAGVQLNDITLAAGQANIKLSTVKSVGAVKFYPGAARMVIGVELTKPFATGLSSTALQKIVSQQVGTSIASGLATPIKVSPLVPIATGTIAAVTQVKPVVVKPTAILTQETELKQSTLVTPTEAAIATPKIYQIPTQTQPPKTKQRQKQQPVQPVPEKLKQPVVEIPRQKIAPVPALQPVQRARAGSVFFTPTFAEPTKSAFFFKLPKSSQPTTKTGKYPVLIRRFGKFKIIGYGKTPKQALSIGKSAVGTTLARTFKVPSFKGFKVAGFKTKKSKKEGLVFIEPSARALSTKSEQKEIKLYKQLKFKSNVRR